MKLWAASKRVGRIRMLTWPPCQQDVRPCFAAQFSHLISSARRNILAPAGKIILELKWSYCAASGGFDDDRHATSKRSCEILLWRNHEHAPLGFADRREPCGDSSKPRPGGADRYGFLTGRRKNGRGRRQRQAVWLDHHGFGQHQPAGAVQFSPGPARSRCL